MIVLLADGRQPRGQRPREKGSRWSLVAGRWPMITLIMLITFLVLKDLVVGRLRLEPRTELDDCLSGRRPTDEDQRPGYLEHLSHYEGLTCR